MLPVFFFPYLFLNYFIISAFYVQYHIRVLEAPEIVALLLAGLEYLINISYVDDTEVFKVCELPLLTLFLLIQLFHFFLSNALMCFACGLKNGSICLLVD